MIDIQIMRPRRPHDRRHQVVLACLLAASLTSTLVAQPSSSATYAARVAAVVRVPGLAAFWDFTLREPGGARRFLAHQAGGRAPAFPLEAVNFVEMFWNEGRRATYDDIPPLGRGPFGDAVQFKAETDPAFRPTLLVPRAAIHDTALDVKGPRASVSMAAWVILQGGNHAIAGIWHEGTDLSLADRSAAARVQPGQRQYALFAGLAANNGAAAVHLSENGRSSFGDRYARNLATTKRLIPRAPPGASDAQLDASWSVVGFVFDNARDTVTAYLDGQAEDYWIEHPEAHPFFQWPARGWQQAYLRSQPGMQPGEDPSFPADQFYTPPERDRERVRVAGGADERVWQDTYSFTRVRVTEQRRPTGGWQETSRVLVALRVNPFWFGHDLYAPRNADEGGPFTIGRVIHSSRGVGTEEYLGGVAVFNRALSTNEMRTLARIGRPSSGQGPLVLLRADQLRKSTVF